MSGVNISIRDIFILFTWMVATALSRQILSAMASSMMFLGAVFALYKNENVNEKIEYIIKTLLFLEDIFHIIHLINMFE